MLLNGEHIHWTTETTPNTIPVVDGVIFTRVSMEMLNTGRTSEHITLCVLVTIFNRGYLVTFHLNSWDFNSVQ